MYFASADCFTCNREKFLFLRIYAHMHTCIVHTYTHTCIHTCIHTYIHTFIHTMSYVHTYIYVYIHTYIYMYTYILTYMHTTTKFGACYLTFLSLYRFFILKCAFSCTNASSCHPFGFLCLLYFFCGTFFWRTLAGGIFSCRPFNTWTCSQL